MNNERKKKHKKREEKSYGVTNKNLLIESDLKVPKKNTNDLKKKKILKKPKKDDNDKNSLKKKLELRKNKTKYIKIKLIQIKGFEGTEKDNCSNCNKLNNINYPFSLEAVECERLLFC